MLCAAVFGAANFSGTACAQPPEREKPKIVDFGKSLKNTTGGEPQPGGQPAAGTRESDDVIKVETNLVRTDVLVIDPKGAAVLGLKESDFVVTEDDNEREIGTFSLGDSAAIPRSIVLIIDYSGSQYPYINTSIDAAKVLIDKLNPNDRMAIVTDNVELLCDFTLDKDVLKRNLDLLANRVRNNEAGKSLQYSALMATLNELFDNGDIRPIVIFQTDGDQYLDIKPAHPAPKQKHSKVETVFTDQDLTETIERSRATIYSVISGASFIGLSKNDRYAKTEELLRKRFGTAPNRFPTPDWARIIQNRVDTITEPIYYSQTSMVTVARLSGGFSENLESPDQADSIYSKILFGINNRYLIGYYTTPETGGKRKNVRIEVRGHPEYVVWGRKYYFSPGMKIN